MKKMNKTVPFLVSVIFMIIMFNAINVFAKKSEILQFTADGHVLGFEKTGLYVATGSHALRIGFAGTKGVIPEAITNSSDSKKARPLKTINYPGLWEGITLTYTHTDNNIFESTYYIEPNANVEDIKLVYNVPVETTENGSLNLKFTTGYMTESPPVAWQEINGVKVPVTVFFRKIIANEAGFEVGQYNRELPLIIDPVLSWNTFMGSSDADHEGYAIAVDSSGNVYVSGDSAATWGSPVNAHAGGIDAFVAKLNSSGTLQWNTFMGSSDADYAYAIAVDSSENAYVTGYSTATWGSPVSAVAGERDAFAAKLNSSGALQWNTFMGSSDWEVGLAIAVDGSGNAYVAGRSDATWGSPVNAHAGSVEAFVAKLNNNGALQWHTFMGSSGSEFGYGIAIDGSGNAYVTGRSSATWGSPVNAHAGGYAAFVAKLNSSGTLQWNTFMGSSGSGWDFGFAIAVDGSGNAYVAGASPATWGSPVNAYAGSNDAFVAKLNSSGVLQWNTFLGSSILDLSYGIAVDSSGNAYVAGQSDATWGSPVSAFAGGTDAFAAKLNSSGALQWNTFMGSSGNDYSYGIAIDGSGNVYVAGDSDATWGSPVSAFAGGTDAFVVKFNSNGAIPIPWIPLLLLDD